MLDPKIHLLPGIHVFNCHIAKKLQSEKELLPQQCKFFNEKLIYMFYGTASYLDYNRSKYRALGLTAEACFPFAFMIDLEDMPIRRIYCTDSGWVHRRIKNGEKLPLSLAELEIGNSISDLFKNIQNFWSGNENYLRSVFPDDADLVSDLDKSRLIFLNDLSQKIQKSFTAPKSSEIDNRVLFNEIQTDISIPFESLTLVAPEIVLGSLKFGNNLKRIETFEATIQEDPRVRLGALNQALKGLIKWR